MICKIIGHNYIPNLERVDVEIHSIGEDITKKEIKYYNGHVCFRCGELINDKKVEAANA